jgi:NAD(P)-dependent dehydrogenase (short-subunit alcohol dehydrogenase family)
MSRVLITGSTEGLGLMAARLLADDGHSVTLHARSAARAEDTRAALPAARAVVVGDLSSIAGMRQVAEQANADGPYDAVIHNAGVGYREPQRIRTDEGLEHVFAINVLAPYLLTGLIERPGRLVYLSSGMHRGGDPGLIRSGNTVAGTARRHTPTASCSTSCSRSPSRGCGLGSYRTRLSLAGYLPEWAAPAHPMTCHSPR